MKGADLALVLKHDMRICATDLKLNKIGERSRFKQLPVVGTEKSIQMTIPEYCGGSTQCQVCGMLADGVDCRRKGVQSSSSFVRLSGTRTMLFSMTRKKQFFFLFLEKKLTLAVSLENH